MTSKKLHIVLHAHLPYVLGHGNWPHGEHWLCEAVAHCYLPLLEVLSTEKGQPSFLLSMVLTPVLCEQLKDKRTIDIVTEFVQQQLRHALAEKSLEATYWQQFYENRLQQLSRIESLLDEFTSLQEQGRIQLLTCAATHAYLPLVGLDGSIALQYWCAARQYKRDVGIAPTAAWTPECAVRPSYEWCTWLSGTPFSAPRHRKDTLAFLAQYSLQATVVEQNTLLQSHGYERVDVLQAGVFSTGFYEREVCVYGRHSDASWRVWSSIFGYPGEFSYLEFHKRDQYSGLRKWRITGAETPLDRKEYYVPEYARRASERHAKDWLATLESVVDGSDGSTACTVAFDAELFGHWWHEGPQFLEAFLHELAGSPLQSEPIGFGAQAKKCSCIQESSWGDQGNHNTWMNEQTYWLWQRLYQLEGAVRSFVNAKQHSRHPRIVAQVLRELMLAQASDWPFLITQGDAGDYATQRFHCHEQDALEIMRLAGSEIESALHYANSCFERNPVFEFLEDELTDALASFLNEPADTGF